MTMTPSPSSTTKPSIDLRSRVERAAQSLRATAADAKAVEEAALRLTAAGNDGAALVVELNTAIESIAAGIEETAAMSAKFQKSQQSSYELAQSVVSGVEETGTSLRELAASIAGVRKDTGLLAESSDSTATSLEQTVRSIRGVSANEIGRAHV